MGSSAAPAPPQRSGWRRLVSRLRTVSPQHRWQLRVVAVAAAAVAMLLLLRGFYQRELYHLTGAAEWMWVSDDVAVRRPTAGLFERTVWLNDHPQEAIAKVCGDRQYVLWINGQPAMAGHNRPGFHLDVVPVTDLLTAGANLVAIEARSPTSVGAVLFALDLTPTAEGRRAGDPRGRNVVVSGPDWWVTRRWRPGVLDAVPSDARHPWIWGRPPDHPWAYPTPVLHERPLVQAVVGDPEQLPATAFKAAGRDRWTARLAGRFGGLLWLEAAPGMELPTAVGVAPDGGAAMTPVVALAGERRWLYPGRVQGTRVEAGGAAPPAMVEVVESVDTRAR